jgi:protein subunit release factor B
LERVGQTKRQIEDLESKLTELDAKFSAREQKNIENMNALIAWVNKTTQKQEAVNQQIALSVSGIDKIQRNKIWLKIADGFGLCLLC